ncbi:MAG: hypothetical protein AAFV29_14490, partial [Myxococcota bacterium]
MKTPRKSVVRSATLTLKKALSMVTMPEMPGSGRLLIRKFDVGRFQEDITPQRLARKLQRQVESLRYAAVRIDAPSAGRADAIALRDDAEASVELVRRLTRHHAPREWFWPMAVPGVASSQTPQKLVQAALRAMMGSSSFAPALEIIVAQLVQTNHAEWLFDLLDPIGPIVIEYLRIHQLPLHASALNAQRLSTPRHHAASVVMSDPWGSVLREYIPRWSARDGRAVWLAALAIRNGPPPSLHSNFASVIHHVVQLAAQPSASQPPDTTESKQ